MAIILLASVGRMGGVNRVEDVLSEGDEIYVKCIGVDRQGKIRLSRREALQSIGHT